MGWLSKPAPPPAPDYAGAAEKTAQSSQDAQTRADWSNRPNQVTPWGTESWSSQAMTDPATGKPVTSWTQTTSLSGPQQQALDDQMAIQAGKSDLAMGMMERVGEATAKPFDPSGLQAYGAGGQQGGIQTSVGGTGLDSRMRLEDAMMARMAPQHAQAQEALEGKLSNMGLTRGSEAWNREMQRMGDQQSRERFNALDRGLAEQQGQFGMGLQAGQFGNTAQQQQFGQGLQQSNYQNTLRQQQIGEQQLMRSIPLNEMNALLTGSQVAMPSMPGFNTSQSSGGVNYSGAAQNQYNASMDAYNAAQQGQQGAMSGIGSIASAGMMMM